MLMPLSISWVGVTVVMIGLAIYRGVLVMHEDDQVFLDKAEAAFETESAQQLVKLKKVERVLKLTTALSAVLFVVVAGLWFYQGLYPS